MSNEHQYQIEWIPASRLSVRWAQSQRPFDEAHARNLAADWDWMACGALLVTAENGNGVRHVVWGQHRIVGAVIHFGDPDVPMPCIAMPIADPAKAAELFLRESKGRKNASALDNFIIAVTAGQPDEVAVNEIINDAGYQVAFSTRPGTIRAVTACLRAYRQHGSDTFREALKLIGKTWGEETDAMHGAIIQGYADLLALYGDGIKRERLTRVVAKQFTPDRLIGAARGSRETRRGRLAYNVRVVLVYAYNNGLREGSRLDDRN